jgi:hypothetical protein
LRRTTSIAAVLILALLAQAAAAVGRAPCAMTSPDPAVTHTVQHHEHANRAAAHAGHQAMTSHGRHGPLQPTAASTADRTTPAHQDGDCCHGMTAMDCATGSCTAGAGTILLLGLPVVTAAMLVHRTYREPDWLPPYLTPTAPIFRPPIA